MKCVLIQTSSVYSLTEAQFAPILLLKVKVLRLCTIFSFLEFFTVIHFFSDKINYAIDNLVRLNMNLMAGAGDKLKMNTDYQEVDLNLPYNQCGHSV